MAGLCAQADPVLIISDGVTTVGPITLTGGSGNFATASFDSSWSVVVATGESKPVVGSASSPTMELDVQATSSGSPNALTIILSDKNFGPTSGNDNMVAQFVGQPLSGSGDEVMFNTYYDPNNGLDALTTLLTSSGTMVPNGGNEYLSNETNSLSQVGPYSLTEVISIAGGKAATYSLLANLQGSNEICNCTLTFCGPSNLSVCGLNQVPTPSSQLCKITATDTCLGKAPVTFLNAVTNIICPPPVSNCPPSNCYPNSGNCYSGSQSCSSSYGNCFSGVGCGGLFNCFSSYGGCSSSYGNNCNNSYNNSCNNGYNNSCNSYGNTSCNNNNNCTTVITYTFGANNGCGQLRTFTETITVNNSSSCNTGCSNPPQNCYPQQPQNCYPQYPN